MPKSNGWFTSTLSENPRSCTTSSTAPPPAITVYRRRGGGGGGSRGVPTKNSSGYTFIGQNKSLRLNHQFDPLGYSTRLGPKGGRGGWGRAWHFPDTWAHLVLIWGDLCFPGQKQSGWVIFSNPPPARGAPPPPLPLLTIWGNRAYQRVVGLKLGKPLF